MGKEARLANRPSLTMRKTGTKISFGKEARLANRPILTKRKNGTQISVFQRGETSKHTKPEKRGRLAHRLALAKKEDKQTDQA